MTHSTSRNAEEILTDIRELRKRVDELDEQLLRATRMQALWPDAFANGSRCTPVIVATYWPPHQPGIYRHYPPPFASVRKVKSTFLRRSDGEEFPLTEEQFFSIYN